MSEIRDNKIVPYLPEIDFNLGRQLQRKWGFQELRHLSFFYRAHSNFISSVTTEVFQFNMRLKLNDYIFFLLHNNISIKKPVNRFLGSCKQWQTVSLGPYCDKSVALVSLCHLSFFYRAHSNFISSVTTEVFQFNMRLKLNDYIFFLLHNNISIKKPVNRFFRIVQAMADCLTGPIL